jgi:phosphate transport system protein
MSGAELRRNYHHELDEIRLDLIRIGQAVIEAIPRATSAVLDGDLEAAEYVISSDDEIDARSIDLEERIVRMLALQQPMAGDLRSLVAALKLTAEIERSFDLVVNICKGSRRLHGHQLAPRLRGVISSMSERAQSLFSNAIDAFADGDVSKAAALDDMDDMLDSLQTEMIQAVFDTYGSAENDLQAAVQLAMLARFYERIGDHAVNIGERVRFQITGWLPEHAGAAKFRAREATAKPAT